MSKRTKFLVSLVLTAALRTGLPASEGATPAVAIERIVVTSSRTDEALHRTPRFTTILDAEDIAATNARTITDLLRTVPGVSITDYTGTGKSVNVDMAGFGETAPSNVLVLIDDRRVNAIDLSNTDWSQISLSQVERIEIMHGSGSVLYGDNAVAGVINIITKRGKGEPGVTLETKGGSFDTWGLTLESGGQIGPASYRLTAETFDTDGYRINSGLERQDFGLEAGYDINDAWHAELTAGHHQDKYGLPGALSESDLVTLGRRASKYPNDHAETLDSFLDLGVRADGNENGVLDVHASVRARSVDSIYTSFSSRYDNYIVTLGLTPKYTLKNELGSHLNTLVLGCDIYHAKDDVLSGGFTGPNDRLEITKTSWGLYALDQFDITERLSLKTGARREDAHYIFRQFTLTQTKAESDLVDEIFQGGLVYTLGPTSSAYVDFAQSFRHPLVDEFFSIYTGLNTAISAQKGCDLEAGVRHDFSDRLSGRISYFQNDIKNEIYYNPISYQNTNYDKTRHQGGICALNCKLCDRFSLQADYTYTLARFGEGAQEGKRIPMVPEHKACLRIDWQATEALYLDLMLTYVGEMFLISDLNNDYARMNDYATLDIKARYLWKKIEFFAGINNLFDAEYAEYGALYGTARNFYPSPGRNVIAGCRLKF